jgi:hypothetical protein
VSVVESGEVHHCVAVKLTRNDVDHRPAVLGMGIAMVLE